MAKVHLLLHFNELSEITEPLYRFTGGTIHGALFDEKVLYGRGQEYTLEILVEKDALSGENVREAFEASLHDICDGLLPLGGGVNRGNGIFTGELITDDGKDR